MKEGIKIKKYAFLLLLSFALLSFMSCSNNNNNVESPTISSDEQQSNQSENITQNTEEDTMEILNSGTGFNKDSIYYQYADESTTNLITNYWNSSGKIFYDGYPEKKAGAFNYWWYAHAIDVMVDAYIRTQDSKYIDYVDNTIDTIIAHNQKIINDYYDDMEWMALALLRLYDETKNEQYLNYVQILWRDIQRGWNDTMGGGIAWRKEQKYYKNTPANAPAVILAARLYKITNDADDLDWAKNIYEFQKNTLVDERTGQVWDGINRENNGKIDKDWNFTYCHGVYIGAGVEMYNITGEESYLNDAKKTADYALMKFIDRRGAFSEEGNGGDGGLFKGILIRYLAELYKVAPELTDIKETINQNADILRDKGTNNIGNFTGSFYTAPDDNTGMDLSVQLSGCMLFEIAAAIND